MQGDRVPAKVLAMRLIPRLDAGLKARFGLGDEMQALGLLSCDSDDVGYTALDEATKRASVTVAYAQSMYAGAANANTALAGEFLGILAGMTPSEVESGLIAARRVIEREACFYSANDADTILYFAHCISRTGSYLSASCGIAEGAPLAYLIAPPLESVYALDKALKAARVRICAFYGPPSPTNFGGALLTGFQSDCQAACDAFARAVMDVANHPFAMLMPDEA